MSEASNSSVPPPVVALSSWLVPGSGYWLLGQRTRALTIGLTIVMLFILGLLIGGVRILQVPKFDDRGNYLSEAPLMKEIRAKPWSITQILAGPISVAGGALSVYASAPSLTSIGAPPRGALSHSHINEIGVLYTAIAGMLNLLAIIDSAYRAGHGEAK